MKKQEGRAKKIMYIICGVSVAVILFAFVWSKGFAKDDSESLSWNEYVKSSVSEERAAKRDNNLVAASKETKDLIREANADREEAARIEEETANLDIAKYLVVVSDASPITQEYIDENFKVIDVMNDRGQEKQLEERTWYYYRRLRKYLEKEEGIIIDLDSGYRSIQGQQDIIDEFTAEHGLEYALYYAAAPGTSEHHTGLAVDICLIVDGVVIDENVAMNAQTEIFGRIHAVLAEFGFVLDFPYESWHIRFVGTPEVAKAYYASGMSFEAFAPWYSRNLENADI